MFDSLKGNGDIKLTVLEYSSLYIETRSETAVKCFIN